MNKIDNKKCCELCLNIDEIKNEYCCILNKIKISKDYYCDDFNLNFKKILNRERYQLYNKYENINKRNKNCINEIQNRPLYNLLNNPFSKKRKLFEIRNLSNLTFLKFHLLTTLLIFSVGVYDLFTLESKFAIPVSFIILGGLTFSILILLIKKMTFRRRTIFTISDFGIVLSNQKTISWKETNALEYINDSGKYFLILKQPFEEELLIDLSSLEYFSKRIYNFIYQIQND